MSRICTYNTIADAGLNRFPDTFEVGPELTDPDAILLRSHPLEAAALADQNINVIDLLNKSRDRLAYNLIDLEPAPSAEAIRAIAGIEHVIKVTVLQAQRLTTETRRPATRTRL